MISPVKNPIVTSKYGNRTLNGKPQFHDGIDYVSGSSREVYAILAGKVILDMDVYEEAKRWTDQRHTLGNYIILQHTLPTGAIVFVRYCHILKNNVSKDQIVPEGFCLGTYADVGYSYGAHLHFDMFDAKWVKIDPSPILAAAGIPVVPA